MPTPDRVGPTGALWMRCRQHDARDRGEVPSFARYWLRRVDDSLAVARQITSEGSDRLSYLSTTDNRLPSQTGLSLPPSRAACFVTSNRATASIGRTNCVGCSSPAGRFSCSSTTRAQTAEGHAPIAARRLRDISAMALLGLSGVSSPLPSLEPAPRRVPVGTQYFVGR